MQGGLRNVILVLPIFLLVACSPAGSPGNATDTGRSRLHANNNSAAFGDYVVHVNALSSATLTPQIASAHDIIRSENLGLINLVVLRKTGEPVSADVKLVAANLTGQLKNVAVEKITEGDSIYYIGVVPVENREMINFDFDVRPAGTDRTLLLRFSHEFFAR